MKLEENITLDELFMLYRACANETNTHMKMLAASQGADVSFDDDWYEPEEAKALTRGDLHTMPIGLMIEEI